MRKSLIILFVSTFLGISLTACSVQRRVDTYEFCNRFNSFYEQEILCPSEYYKSSSLSEYNYFIKINEVRTAIVTMQTNENNNVSAIQLTVTKDEAELSKEEKELIFRYFTHLASILNSQSQDDTLEQINNSGYSKDETDFNSYNFSFSTPECKYTVLCSTYIISFYAELKI